MDLRYFCNENYIILQADLSILFFVKKVKKDKSGKAPIFCRITVNGKRAEFSVNEKIEPLKWDTSSHRVKGRAETSRVINDSLDYNGYKIKRFYNSYREKGIDITAKLLKDSIVGKNIQNHYLIETFNINNFLLYS